MKERTILALVIMTLVVLTIGYLVAMNVDLMPTAASSRALLVDQLARILLGLATVVFIVVQGALIYAIVRFRKRKGDESDATAYHGNNTLELIWTVIPAIMVIFIGFYSFRVLTEIEVAADDELVVEVIGQQFIWQFRYPTYDVRTQELHLPVGQQVRFEITTPDVIHSFWVPAFRAKRDATPGQVSELVITPIELGSFPIRCAELCGVGHSIMNSVVTVETEEDFLSWIGDQSAGLPTQAVEETDSIPAETDSIPAETEVAVTESAPLEGSAIFRSYDCIICHVLDDAGGFGVVGPSMEGIGDTASTRDPDVDARAYLLKSIVNPDAFIVAGYSAGIMPANFEERISPEELEVLVDYLLAQ